jgi:hypothetical protein
VSAAKAKKKKAAPAIEENNLFFRAFADQLAGNDNAGSGRPKRKTKGKSC